MPHYKNGTPAKVGDLVQGRGYNVKGELRGYVLRIMPGAESCNIVIGANRVKHDANPGIGANPSADFVDGFHIEYGQADAFEKIDSQ